MEPYPPAVVEDAPTSTGVGFLVTGGVFTGLGAVNLLTAPICKTDLISNRDVQNGCLVASLVAGGAFLAVGVPLLIVGGVKRSKYKQWKASHPIAAGLDFSATDSGGALLLRGQF